MLTYSFSLFRFGFKVGKHKSRIFFYLCFFYISRCKWQHDRRKSRNDSHIQLEVDATNDTPSSSISNVKEENNK